MAVMVWAIERECGVQAGISRDMKQKGHGGSARGKAEGKK